MLKIPPNICKLLDQYFDKIIVLSVPRFVERHEKVKQNLEGLPFEFFYGMDKLNLNIDEQYENKIYDAKKANKLSRSGKGLNSGEVACAISHRNIYTTMIQNGWEKLLIFEDDVLPITENLHTLTDALNELPDDWELLYLGYLKHEKITAGLKIKHLFYKAVSWLGFMKWNYRMVSNLLPKPFSRHLKIAGFHDCTHAYAITLSAAKKLAAAQEPVIFRADDLIAHSIMNGETKAFVTVPKFFDQQGFHNENIISSIKEQ